MAADSGRLAKRRRASPPAPAASPLLGEVAAVEVVSPLETKTLHIHEAAVNAIPYLQVQRARWTSGQRPLRIQLPEDICIEAVAHVFEQAYFPGHPPVDLGVGMLLQVVQAAFMLNCSEDVVRDSCSRLQDAIMSGEHLETLAAFCAKHEVPKAVSDLASRLLQREVEEMSREELCVLLKTGLEQHDAEAVALAERLIKKWSRRGGAAREGVAWILQEARVPLHQRGRGAQETLIAMSADFLEARPSFYAALSPEMITGGRSLHNWAPRFMKPLVAKWFHRFAAIGIKHLQSKALTVDDLLPLYHALSQKSLAGYDPATAGPVLFFEECLQELVRILPSLPPTAQVRLFQKLTELSSFDIRLCRADILAAVSPEARLVFSEKLVTLPDSTLKIVLTEPLLKLMDRACKRQLCARASQFQHEVKSSLLSLITPANSDSDEGY